MVAGACSRGPPAASPRVIGFAVAVPGKEQIPFDDSPVLDLSRDGTRARFHRRPRRARLLYVRSRDRIEPGPVPGTEGAYSPFFSPDGQWIGFFADGKLKKVPASGGAADRARRRPEQPRRRLARGRHDRLRAELHLGPEPRLGPRGQGRDADDSRRDGGRAHPPLADVPPRRFGRALHDRPAHGPRQLRRRPHGGLGADDRKTRVLFEGGSMARVARSSHLVFWRGGAMLASAFRREGAGACCGEPRRARREDERRSLERRRVRRRRRATARSPSCPRTIGERRLILTDRAGRPRTVPVPPRAYHYPRFSPDGKRIAVTIGPGHGIPTTSGSARSRRAL